MIAAYRGCTGRIEMQSERYKLVNFIILLKMQCILHEQCYGTAPTYMSFQEGDKKSKK